MRQRIDRVCPSQVCLSPLISIIHFLTLSHYQLTTSYLHHFLPPPLPAIRKYWASLSIHGSTSPQTPYSPHTRFYPFSWPHHPPYYYLSGAFLTPSHKIPQICIVLTSKFSSLLTQATSRKRIKRLKVAKMEIWFTSSVNHVLNGLMKSTLNRDPSFTVANGRSEVKLSENELTNLNAWRLQIGARNADLKSSGRLIGHRHDRIRTWTLVPNLGKLNRLLRVSADGRQKEKCYVQTRPISSRKLEIY